MTTTMTSTHPHAAMMAHFRAVAAFVALAVAAYLLGGGSAGLDVWMPVEPAAPAEMASSGRWRGRRKPGRCRREWRRRLSSPSRGGGGWRDARVRRRPLPHDLRRARGFTLALHGDAGADMRISTTGLRGGRTPIPCHPWPVAGAGQRRLPQISSGQASSSRVASTDGELEWDFVLDSPLAGTGALRIDARVTGDATRLDIGDIVVKDRTGAELLPGPRHELAVRRSA